MVALETNNSTALSSIAPSPSCARDQLDDAALKDYEALQRQFPKAHQIYYGLGEIAYRRKDTNTAIRHYEAYLSNAPPNNRRERNLSLAASVNSKASRPHRNPDAAMRVTHVITRLIVGGAQENTIASVLGLRRIPGLEVDLISGPTTGPEGSLESEFARMSPTR